MAQQAKQSPPASAAVHRAAAGGRAATSAGRRSKRSTTRTTTSCAATSPRRARSARAGSRAPAAATRIRSRSPSSARARWRSSRTSRPVGQIVDVILLQDVEKVGLRGDVVNVSRGFMRNYLQPRGLAETATPARVAELDEARGAAGPPRGAQLRARAGDRARRCPRRGASLRGQRRPAGHAVRLGHADRHRGRALASTEDPRRPAQDRSARDDQAHRALRRCRSTSSRTCGSR